MKIVRSALPCTGVQFRESAYGSSELRQFLRDVLALANADVEGPRYIVVGVGFDAKGNKRIYSVDESDFTGKPSYGALAGDYIEPPLRVKYLPVNISGNRVGVFEIGDGHDRPYMMKSDFSERLRRGDAYVRIDRQSMKMGRRQLMQMFQKKFRESVDSNSVEVGFPGEIIHKNLKIATVDLSRMPSSVASANMQELIDTRQKLKESASSTGMVRLTHARLFGSDSPYEDKSPSIMFAEMARLKEKFKFDDQYFLFEQNTSKIQLVIYNQGSDPIQDASLVLTMPNHNDFYVGSRLPKIPRDGKYVESSDHRLFDYPTVTLKDHAVQVTNTLGEIPANGMVEAFDTPLRVCVGAELKGRKLGVRYALYGSNLLQPATGKLRLTF